MCTLNLTPAGAGSRLAHDVDRSLSAGDRFLLQHLDVGLGGPPEGCGEEVRHSGMSSSSYIACFPASLTSQVHVDRYKRRIYEAAADAELLQATTVDPLVTRFHACERWLPCEHSKPREGRPAVRVEMAELELVPWDLRSERAFHSASTVQPAQDSPYSLLDTLVRPPGAGWWFNDPEGPARSPLDHPRAEASREPLLSSQPCSQRHSPKHLVQPLEAPARLRLAPW